MRSTMVLSSFSGFAPEKDCTFWPFFKNTNVGILEMSNRSAKSSHSSTSTWNQNQKQTKQTINEKSLKLRLKKAVDWQKRKKQVIARYSQMLTLTTTIFAAYCWANFSKTGEITLHGPHQVAKKSAKYSMISLVFY